MVKHNQLGFTFIELMIVVAIISLLASIAYPAYQRHIIKAKRSEVKAEMLEVATSLQRYKIANFSFMKNGTTPVTLSDIGQPSSLPKTGDSLYTLALSNVTAGTWRLTATPTTTGIMNGNGVIVLNSQNQKCWTKGQSTCTPSATSSWDD